MSATLMFKNPLPLVVTAIIATGALRFALTVWGVSDDITKYASMTVIILGAALYYGLRAASYRELLRISYALLIPYMLVEIAAIGYTWSTGRRTIFHAPQYSFGTPIHLHFWGHAAGGLTWEPLSVFMLMAILRALRTRVLARR